jgi:hypothetical protein
MNKAVGVLVIGLGILLIVMGIQGSQDKVLNAIKAVNPKIRTLTGTGTGTAENSGGTLDKGTGGSTKTIKPGTGEVAA